MSEPERRRQINMKPPYVQYLEAEVGRLRAALQELRDEYPKFRMLDIIDEGLGEPK